MKCNVCNKDLAIGDKFCSNCGIKVNTNDTGLIKDLSLYDRVKKVLVERDSDISDSLETINYVNSKKDFIVIDFTGKCKEVYLSSVNKEFYDKSKIHQMDTNCFGDYLEAMINWSDSLKSSIDGDYHGYHTLYGDIENIQIHCETGNGLNTKIDISSLENTKHSQLSPAEYFVDEIGFLIDEEYDSIEEQEDEEYDQYILWSEYNSTNFNLAILYADRVLTEQDLLSIKTLKLGKYLYGFDFEGSKDYFDVGLTDSPMRIETKVAHFRDFINLFE
jgi:hypothetical protein